jgi:hypothetical protein
MARSPIRLSFAGRGALSDTVSGITGQNKEGIDDRTAAGDRVELQSWRGV